LDHQNNYVERLSVDDNVITNFNILPVFYTIILLVQTKLFSDLYLAKSLHISAKPSFRVYCTNLID